MRKLDLNLQMRTIATQLRSEEMPDIIGFYGGGADVQPAGR
jgi:hypothetical protein